MSKEKEKKPKKDKPTSLASPDFEELMAAFLNVNPNATALIMGVREIANGPFVRVTHNGKEIPDLTLNQYVENLQRAGWKIVSTSTSEDELVRSWELAPPND